MSALGLMFGLTASTLAGTLESKSAFCLSVKLRARAILPHVAPGMPPPPWTWLVPVRVTMLMVMPPLPLSAEPCPNMKLLSWNEAGSRYMVEMLALPSRLETSIPSIVNLLPEVPPRTVMLDCRKPSDPPTSTLLRMTPGMTLATDHTSVRFGSSSSWARVMTVCLSATEVSSKGACPVTVTPSDMAPTSSLKSARAFRSELTTMFRASAGLNPCNSALTT